MEISIIKDSSEIEKFMEIIKSAWASDNAIYQFYDTLHSMPYHGGFLLGAYDNDKMVGMSFSYPGFRNNKVYLYSHMTGVINNKKYSNIGYELKIKQKELALDYGYDLIVWTFDPMMSLNAYFNLNKLGALSRNYIDNFYGNMRDGINRGVPTDRLVAEWYIKNSYNKSYEKPEYINTIDENNIYFSEIKSDLIALRIFNNYGELKNTDLNKAVKIKLEYRHIFHELLNKNYTVINFDKNSYSYIFKKDYKINEKNIFL